MAVYDHFWPFFCQLYVHPSQNWGSHGLQKVWLQMQIFSFPFFMQLCKKIFAFFMFMCFFALWVITFVPLDSLRTSQWPSEPQLCESWTYSWQKITRNEPDYLVTFFWFLPYVWFRCFLYISLLQKKYRIICNIFTEWCFDP